MFFLRQVTSVLNIFLNFFVNFLDTHTRFFQFLFNSYRFIRDNSFRLWKYLNYYMLKSYFGIIFFSPRCRLIIYRTFYSETCEYYQFGIKERRDFIVKKTGKKTMPMFIHGDGNWSNLEIFFNNICRISLNISVKRKN